MNKIYLREVVVLGQCSVGTKLLRDAFSVVVITEECFVVRR